MTDQKAPDPGSYSAAARPTPAKPPASKKKKWIIGGSIAAGVLVLSGIGNAITSGTTEDPAPAETVAAENEQTSEPVIEAEEPAKPAPAPEPEVPIEHQNALKTAENYISFMPLSKAGLYDQLTAEAGDQFSAEAAQYAVDTIAADWNEQALKSARNYQDTMSMSPEAIRDQLTSEYGGRFTQAEADYAIANLG